ncbi:hypothetical protein SDC9_138066 [bioreactor metagenome]|uniref:Uncharacterized protein n=1 Tax=bioreactor metagenome TaxID=1076179 RepID=A0A645DQF2_9ZZZZ
MFRGKKAHADPLAGRQHQPLPVAHVPKQLRRPVQIAEGDVGIAVFDGDGIAHLHPWQLVNGGGWQPAQKLAIVLQKRHVNF